jgi:cytochrome c553
LIGEIVQFYTDLLSESALASVAAHSPAHKVRAAVQTETGSIGPGEILFGGT